MTTLSSTSNFYLVPGEDWKTNLERFSNGAKTTESEVKAQESYDKLNTKGKVLAAVACAVAVIAVGILLGIIINPAAYAICIVSVICLGAIVYFLKQDESYKNDLIEKKQETANVCEAMIKAMWTLRDNIARVSLSGIESYEYSSRDHAEDASLNAVQELRQNQNNQVTKEYLSIEDFVKRIAPRHNLYPAPWPWEVQVNRMKTSADRVIYGAASKSIPLTSKKSYHYIEKTRDGAYKLHWCVDDTLVYC